MLFDPDLVEAVVEATPTPVAVALLVLSFAGSAFVIGPVAAAAYLFGDRRRTATWIGIVAGIYAVMAITKPLFGIARPAVASPVTAETLPTVLEPLAASANPVTDDAFPSGHMIAATAFWGLAAIDLEIGTRGYRIAVATGLIAIVAVSRLALGVHYPVDLLAGVAVGVAYLAVALWVRRAVDWDVPTMIVAGLGVAGLAMLGPWADRVVDLVGVAAGGLLAWTWLASVGAVPQPAPWWTRRRAIVAGGILTAVIAAGLAVPEAIDGSRWKLPVFCLVGAVLVAGPALFRRIHGRPVRTEGQKQ